MVGGLYDCQVESTSTGLAQVLERQGRRRDWVAQQLGIDPTTVSRWCLGQRELPPERVPQLAALLGVTEDEIREGGLSEDHQNAPAAGAEQANSAAASISEVQDAETGTLSETAANGSQGPSRRSADPKAVA